MAPEQVKGENVTVRTDVYAATLVLWELLARRRAIQRGALPDKEVLAAMAKAAAPVSSTCCDRRSPKALRDTIRAGLEPSPEKRLVHGRSELWSDHSAVDQLGRRPRGALADTLARLRPVDRGKSSCRRRCRSRR